LNSICCAIMPYGIRLSRLVNCCHSSLFCLLLFFFFLMLRRLPISTLFPYTTLFRSIPGSPRSARPRPPCCMNWHRCRRRQVLLRSEEHTSELQSRGHLVCRLLLEKKKHIPSIKSSYLIRVPCNCFPVYWQKQLH